jgi:hypothetical protein
MPCGQWTKFCQRWASKKLRAVVANRIGIIIIYVSARYRRKLPGELQVEMGKRQAQGIPKRLPGGSLCANPLR